MRQSICTNSAIQHSSTPTFQHSILRLAGCHGLARGGRTLV